MILCIGLFLRFNLEITFGDHNFSTNLSTPFSYGQACARMVQAYSTALCVFIAIAVVRTWSLWVLNINKSLFLPFVRTIDVGAENLAHAKNVIAYEAVFQILAEHLSIYCYCCFYKKVVLQGEMHYATRVLS